MHNVEVTGEERSLLEIIFCLFGVFKLFVCIRFFPFSLICLFFLVVVVCFCCCCCFVLARVCFFFIILNFYQAMFNFKMVSLLET